LPPERPERPERPEEHGSQAERRDSYGTPQREYRAHAEESRERHDPWYSQQGREDRNAHYDQPHSAGPSSAQSDEQAGETSRRAAGQTDADYPQTSPDGDDRAVMYSGQYTPEQRRDGVIQSDPKKRKRNFSNRTKTGCLTCRRRKKKCDEAKPECGFILLAV
jgi:hypothetical protein